MRSSSTPRYVGPLTQSQISAGNRTRPWSTLAGVRNGTRMNEPQDTSVAVLFASAVNGDRASSSALYAALYSELHRVASRELNRQGWGVSLGATSLLHEAYFDLSRRDGAAFPDRARFMAYAARVMRGLIVDYARNKQAQKRGGQFELTALSTDTLGVATAVAGELVRISDALDDLSSVEA